MYKSFIKYLVCNNVGIAILYFVGAAAIIIVSEMFCQFPVDFFEYNFNDSIRSA